MTQRTERWLWRTGAGLLFLALPLVLVAIFVADARQIAETQGLAARQEALLAQIVRRAAARHAPGVVSAADLSALYLRSGTSSLARAEIEARGAALVEAAGGHLEEAQLLGTPEQEAAGTVVLQLVLTIDNKGLLDLVYAVETQVPLLTVASLTAEPEPSRAEERSDATPRTLHVELTIQGRFRKTTG